MFSPFGLPEGITLLVTDALSAPANFFLHQTLAACMKDRRDSKCVILSVSEDITRWKALAAKAVIIIIIAFFQSSLLNKRKSRILTCSIAWTLVLFNL
jgi:hypothetical protein